VQEAASGEEALLRMDPKPDIVMLDVYLGSGMDGLEVCRRLKADSATAAIPVILISSHRVSCTDRFQGLESGADDYLIKPVDLAEMVAHIKALLLVRKPASEDTGVNTSNSEARASRHNS
jgi:two-component system cell cycle response regulator